ncbi:MAG TPA: ABC transporter permease [Gemmatimonadaceae bacterium]|nr:ABC transporter permease [Gemmatimonadaceae bacterium]
MADLLRGFRPTFRSLARSRTFTVTAILTLALGMGAATAIYTLLDRVVLAPLPYPSPDRLVRLKNPVPGVGRNTEWELSTAQYFYFTQHASTLARVGIYNLESGILVGADGRAAQRVQVADVTATMFDLLGATAERGRMIDARDDTPGAPRVAVLSDGFWRRQYGGADAVIGSTVDLDGQPTQIVGVMAPGVELPAEPGQPVGLASDVWVPRQLNPAGPFYNSHVYPGVARLAPGATLALAQAELDRLTTQLPAQFPNVYSQQFITRYGFHTRVAPLKTYVIGATARYLWILFAAVGLVLAIACANVVNLLLVRLESRRRETAVRTALGASWWNLAADAFREGIVISAAGGALAVLIAFGGTHWLVSLAPPGLPRLDNLRMDGRVYLFALALAVTVAAVLALVPALQARGASTHELLGDGGRSTTAGVQRRRLRSALVVTQVALALVLVTSAGLLLRSFGNLRRVDPGVRPEGVFTVSLYLPPQQYDSAHKEWQFYSRFLANVRALPGVTSAGLSGDIPFQGGYGCTIQAFEDHAVYDRIKTANETTCAGQEPTTPGYFAAMGIPMLKGRAFTDADNTDPSRGAVIVSKAFADYFWPGENPLGKGVGPNGDGKPPFYRVVGVAGDVHSARVDEPPALAIYYPIVPLKTGWAWDTWGMSLVVRTAKGTPMSYLPAVRRVVTELDPGVPLANAADMTTIVGRSMSQLTFTMTLLGIAGLTALLLAAVGLYGVISYIVARRTNELGVRLALGAQPAQVRGLVVRDALRLAVAGLALGVVAALATSRVLGGLLYGVAPWDPWVYAGAALALGAVALLAGWIPARRAAAVDPAVALRAE